MVLNKDDKTVELISQWLILHWKKMVPTALISSEEHITLILVVASRKVYEYKRKYLCHFFFIKHSPALGWKIIKCKTMEINKRGLNIWILNWLSASRPDAPHHIKTYIKLLEGRTAMRKIFQFVSVLLSLSVIWQAIWLPTGRRWFNYIQELYQYALNENTLRVINCTYALRLKNKTPYGLVTILVTCPHYRWCPLLGRTAWYTNRHRSELQNQQKPFSGLTHLTSFHTYTKRR